MSKSSDFSNMWDEGDSAVSRLGKTREHNMFLCCAGRLDFDCRGRMPLACERWGVSTQYPIWAGLLTVIVLAGESPGDGGTHDGTQAHQHRGPPHFGSLELAGAPGGCECK